MAPAVAVERSITGKLHVHRLLSGSDPVVFDDHHFTLKLTRAELVTLTADVGRTLYFMPHYRDEVNWANYRFIVLLESITSVHGINAMQEHFLATIYSETIVTGACRVTISQAESGLTSTQYTNIQAAIGDLSASVILQRYGPVWTQHDTEGARSGDNFDAAIAGAYLLRAYVGSYSDLEVERLADESGGDEVWGIGRHGGTQRH